VSASRRKVHVLYTDTRLLVLCARFAEILALVGDFYCRTVSAA
jgi:hypothetical protein